MLLHAARHDLRASARSGESLWLEHLDQEIELLDTLLGVVSPTAMRTIVAPWRERIRSSTSVDMRLAYLERLEARLSAKGLLVMDAVLVTSHGVTVSEGERRRGAVFAGPRGAAAAARVLGTLLAGATVELHRGGAAQILRDQPSTANAPVSFQVAFQALCDASGCVWNGTWSRWEVPWMTPARVGLLS